MNISHALIGQPDSDNGQMQPEQSSLAFALIKRSKIDESVELDTCESGFCRSLAHCERLDLTSSHQIFKITSFVSIKSFLSRWRARNARFACRWHIVYVLLVKVPTHTTTPPQSTPFHFVVSSILSRSCCVDRKLSAAKQFAGWTRVCLCVL